MLLLSLFKFAWTSTFLMKFSVGLATSQFEEVPHQARDLLQVNRLKPELLKERSSVLMDPALIKRTNNEKSILGALKGGDSHSGGVLGFFGIQKKLDEKFDSIVSRNIKSEGKEEVKKEEEEDEEKKEEKEELREKEEAEKELFTKDMAPPKCKVDNLAVEALGQLVDISECKVFFGNIIIHNIKEPYISLNGIKSIDGSLIIEKSPDLIRVEAPQLQAIGHNFELKELTSLSLISFPKLTSIKTVDWQVIPMLNSVTLGDEVSDVQSIIISDTAMTKFSGFTTDELEIFDLNNNRYLESVKLDVQVVSNKLHFAANADEISISLPNLEKANNMSIHEVESLDLSSLVHVENSVSFIHNYFTELKIPKLKKIGGTLSISKNAKLVEVEFPSTTDIGGGLMIVNNTNIEKINFLPKLTILGGAMEFVGNIKEMSFNQLKLVKGSAKIQTNAVTFDCTKWSRSSVGSVIRGGKIECTSANNQKIISKTPTDENEIVFSDDDSPNSSEGNTRKTSGASTTMLEFTKNWIILVFILLLAA